MFSVQKRLEHYALLLCRQRNNNKTLWCHPFKDEFVRCFTLNGKIQSMRVHLMWINFDAKYKLWNSWSIFKPIEQLQNIRKFRYLWFFLRSFFLDYEFHKNNNWIRLVTSYCFISLSWEWMEHATPNQRHWPLETFNSWVSYLVNAGLLPLSSNH